MNYKFHVDSDHALFDSFVQEHTYANILQQTKWSKIKDNWGHHFMSVTLEGSIVATAMVLVKEMPLGFKLFYIPRGPIMDYENVELVTFFFKEMKKFAKKQQAICIKFDPLVIYNSFLLKNKEERKEYEHPTTKVLKSLGMHHYGYNFNMYEVTQPRTQAVLYYTENWRDAYSSNLKKNLQRAKNKGVQVKQVGKEGIAIFADLLKKTGDRKGVALRNQEYFEKLMDVYQEECAVFLTYINQKELLEEAQSKLNAIQEDLKVNPKSEKKMIPIRQTILGLEKEIERLTNNIAIDGDVAYISGSLICKDKHTSELLYAGMDDKYSKYYSSYVSYLKAIEWAEDQGCSKCNFGGVQGTLDDGLTSFKETYLPYFEDYLGEFDMPVMPLCYRMFVVALPLAKKAIRGIRSWKK